MLAILFMLGRARIDAQEIGKFRNTHYYVVLEADFPNERRDAALLSMDGTVLAQVSAAFKRAADIEGTAKLLDGRVLNFAGRKPDGIRWLFTNAPHGLGKGNCQLVPFGTIAVDPTRIPLGATVRIAETEGMLLPDGRRHDGVWKAEDMGGAIKGDRIDLFVGDGKARGKVLADAGITHLQPLTVTLVAPPPPDEESCVHRDPQVP